MSPEFYDLLKFLKIGKVYVGIFVYNLLVSSHLKNRSKNFFGTIFRTSNLTFLGMQTSLVAAAEASLNRVARSE